MADINNIYTEIRCAAYRPHFIFNRCGGLIGGVVTSQPSTTIHVCPICGQFWVVTVNLGNEIIMQPIKRGKKIRFLKRWRTIVNGG